MSIQDTQVNVEITDEEIEALKSKFSVQEAENWQGPLERLFYHGDEVLTVRDAFLVSLAKYAILKEQKGDLVHDGLHETCGLCQFFVECDYCPIYLLDDHDECLGTHWEAYWSARPANLREAGLEAAVQEFDYLRDLYRRTTEILIDGGISPAEEHEASHLWLLTLRSKR